MSYYFLCTVPEVIYISKEKHETNFVTYFKPHLGVTGPILFSDAFHGSASQNGSILILNTPTTFRDSFQRQNITSS